jgi:hypothetical protein
MIEEGPMPESLPRWENAAKPAQVASFKSERWPDLFRNGGRLQIGIQVGFTSEHRAGINRNPQASEHGKEKRVKN